MAFYNITDTVIRPDRIASRREKRDENMHSCTRQGHKDEDTRRIYSIYGASERTMADSKRGIRLAALRVARSNGQVNFTTYLRNDAATVTELLR